MATKLSVINQALVLIGETPISSMAQPVGTIIETVYDTVKETLLSEHRWRFAVKKTNLSAAPGSPLNEWKNHFTLPTDMLLLIRTYPNSDYEIFQNKLATNEQSVAIDYVYDPSEPKYPEYFVKALATQLAADIALAVTNDKSLAQLMEQKAMRFLMTAQHKDSQGRPSTPIQSRPYIDVRG